MLFKPLRTNTFIMESRTTFMWNNHKISLYMQHLKHNMFDKENANNFTIEVKWGLWRFLWRYIWTIELWNFKRARTIIRAMTYLSGHCYFYAYSKINVVYLTCIICRVPKYHICFYVQIMWKMYNTSTTLLVKIRLSNIIIR